MNFDLFVIGGGSGGVRCARIAASHGARVGVAEQRFWGGTCVNVGCVPKKLMVQGADYGASITDARGFGWQTPAASPDFGAMMTAINTEVARLSGLYRTMLRMAQVEVYDAPAYFLDAHTLCVGGERMTAETIVIATGGQALRPHFRGSDLAHLSDDVFTLTELPRRVTILGGGYIGVEFAGVFAGLGSEVDLIYRQPLPLRGFDEDMRTGLAEILAESGITLHPQNSIASLESTGDGLSVTCDDGTVLGSDFVLCATGRAPATATLELNTIGVSTNAAGAVRVDADHRTTVPHVYAIGDVIDQLNLTPVALAQGHILAEKLFGPAGRSWNFHHVPTAVFSRPPIATVGPSEEEAARQGVVDIYMTHFTPLKHRITGRAHYRSTMKLIVDHDSQRVLGAHMIGEDAPEIIQGLAIAITAGASKQDIDRTIGIHPTAAEEFVTMRTLTRTVGM